MRFYADSLEDAESRIERLAAIFNLGAPQLFAVRGVLNAPQAQQNSLPGGPSYTVVNDPRDAAQGGIIDVAGEQPGQPGGSTPPELNFGEFTGQWKVMVNGREVYRFGGIGNSQADANRVAAQWLRNNGMGVSGEGFEVYPVIAESITESKKLTLKDFVVNISQHALDQCYNRGVNADEVDEILRNINQAKHSIMGQPAGAAFILHNGQDRKSTRLNSSH